MSNLLEKTFKNDDLGFEITSYIDKQQNGFFLGKDVASILGYSNTKEALKRHVSEENKMIRFMKVNCRGRETRPQQNDNRGKYFTIINEPGFYELVFGSKLEFAKKFRQWVGKLLQGVSVTYQEHAATPFCCRSRMRAAVNNNSCCKSPRLLAVT